MRHDPTFWILARASGLTAYVMLTLSVLAGLVVKSRPFRALKPAAVSDLHRILAMLGLGALAGHAAALVLDTTVHVSVAGLFIPGLISYRPAWTSLGILAAELMVLVYASFSMRKRIGTKDCGGCTGLPTASSASRRCMALRPCTDSAQPWVFGLYVAAVASVAGATAWRILVPPARARPRRPASTDNLARPTGASRSTVRSGATSAAVSGVSRVS